MEASAVYWSLLLYLTSSCVISINYDLGTALGAGETAVSRQVSALLGFKFYWREEV